MAALLVLFLMRPLTSLGGVIPPRRNIGSRLMTLIPHRARKPAALFFPPQGWSCSGTLAVGSSASPQVREVEAGEAPIGHGTAFCRSSRGGARATTTDAQSEEADPCASVATSWGKLS
ncbi:hypothetical protein C8Q77DRAFT_872794 [Trametes polyzona]|nr:hypothetical protein C8Q77DRAFT_872794 [Trametes polyzona]